MSLGAAAGAASSGLGVYQGLQQGGASGYGSAAINAGKLANSTGAFGDSASGVGTGLGVAGNALGIYNGVKQGGVAGYGGAAANAASIGGQVAGVGSAFVSGPVAALDLYNEIKGWESGNTGKDALQGAETGAAVGTMILPGIGTVIGAVGGAIAGGISSAFGNGRVDPENQNFEGYTQAYNKAPPGQQSQLAQSVENPYTVLAGYFDLRDNQLKGSNPIYKTYGRMGEQQFTNDLVNQVRLGQAHGITDPQSMMSSVVQPWLQSFGDWQDSNKGAMTSLIQNMTGQIMSGTYTKNFKAVGGQQVFH